MRVLCSTLNCPGQPLPPPPDGVTWCVCATVNDVVPLRKPLAVTTQPPGRFPVHWLRNVVNSDDACLQLRLPLTLMMYGPAGSDSEPTWSLLSTWKVPGQAAGAGAPGGDSGDARQIGYVMDA